MPINFNMPRISQEAPVFNFDKGGVGSSGPNALQNELTLLRAEGQQTTNALNKKRLEDYEAKKSAKDAADKQQMVSKALSDSLQLAKEVSPEAATSYFKNVTGQDIGFEFRGPKLKMTWDTPDQKRVEINAYPEHLQEIVGNVMQGKDFDPNALAGNADAYAGSEVRVTNRPQKEGAQWGQPYLDAATGALMQKDAGTGKISKIASPPRGMVIESDGKGGFTMRTGVDQDKEIGVKAKNTVEQKIIDANEQVARMGEIRSVFKPEYQQTAERLGNSWTSIKASLGRDVSEEDAKSLTDFKSFQRRAITNINMFIKEFTGAQMSEKEADRLRLSQPDPGEKWYTGDDPITFKAKMDDVDKATRAAIARYNSYKQKGLSDAAIKELVNSGNAIPLDKISERME